MMKNRLLSDYWRCITTSSFLYIDPPGSSTLAASIMMKNTSFPHQHAENWFSKRKWNIQIVYIIYIYINTYQAPISQGFPAPPLPHFPWVSPAPPAKAGSAVSSPALRPRATPGHSWIMGSHPLFLSMYLCIYLSIYLTIYLSNYLTI